MPGIDAQSIEPIPGDLVRTFRSHLLEWWEQNHRDLPWRHTRDPYRILVSEVMLQQTQVDRVIPYYHEWLATFPTVEALASAPVAEVIRKWKGLGYNRRAVNLQRTAQAVVEMGGDFPRTVAELLTLPGIGPYTAGAIACFAFEQDVPFFDTNMKRVLHRVLIGSDVPKPAVPDRVITELAAHMLPSGNGWVWNQALIEFGAIQCTARKPLCVICPMQAECQARPVIHAAIAANTRKPGGTGEVFETTNRYFRGRVVDALREDSSLTLQELGPKVKADFTGEDAPWLYTVVQGLARDGLARIAEPDAPYTVSEETLPDITVTLPE